MSQTKQPKRYPTFILKCVWDATAIVLKIEARNELAAIDKAWMKVAKMEGGMSCLGVKVLRQLN